MFYIRDDIYNICICLYLQKTGKLSFEQLMWDILSVSFSAEYFSQNFRSFFPYNVHFFLLANNEVLHYNLHKKLFSAGKI